MGTIPGDYSMIAFTENTQKRIAKSYNDKNIKKRAVALNTGESLWEAPADYKGGHYDHFYNFFQAIRGKGEIIQDPTFGLRATGAALLANKSYFQKSAVNWNPETMMLL
jgi:hypothetical protein